jgi:hypothetical protein
LGKWNGHYRAPDDKGMIVHESFVKPLQDEEEAYRAANAEAHAWIGGQ